MATMLARTHKPLAIVNQYQMLANNASVTRPLCFIPLQQWSQWSVNCSTNPNRDPSGKPSSPSAENPACVRSCESEASISSSKKLFVVAPSRSLSSVEKHVTPPEEPISSNPLPPKPKVVQKSPPPVLEHQPSERLDQAKASVATWIELLRNLNWRTALFTAKEKVVGAAGAIAAPGNVERVRQGAIMAWDISVRAVQNLIYWIRVFLDSREYYYLRYYTLLMVENTIYYARLGLIKILELTRNLKQ
uniref:Uncharacterized protein n=1 Tax=Aedes aegypti TaxID=7159 RepID=A0A903VWI7_AEDAE